MFKNTPYLIGLLFITIAANAVVVQWLYPSPPPAPTDARLDQVLRGIKQQSTSIATLESNLKQLSSDITRVETKTHQQDTQAAAIAELQTRLAGQTAAGEPVDAKTAAIPDARLTKLDQQFADLQQQLDILLVNQNQSPLNNNAPQQTAAKPDPNAGLSQAQIEQKQEAAMQQKTQQLESSISATADPGKTSQIGSHFESYLSSANIVGTPPQVNCGATLCHFQFNQTTLRTSEGDEMDPMLILMESGTFPADGTQRTIITRENAQGGLDLYVGNEADFPK